jgi:hypothetical protein
MSPFRTRTAPTMSLFVAALAVIAATLGWYWLSWSFLGDFALVGDSFGGLSALFSGLGLVGIGFALVHEARVTLEQRLGEEYRILLKDLPLAALVWERADDSPEPTAAREESELRSAYRYFDLCNSQAFFFKQGQVRRRTWHAWRQGMVDHLRRQWFQDCWHQLFVTDRKAEGPQTQHLRFLWEEVMQQDEHLKAAYGPHGGQRGAVSN